MAPQQPVRPGIGVASGMTERKPDRRPLLLQRLAHLQKTGKVVGRLVVAGDLKMTDPVVDAGAGRALRQRNPFLIARAVLDAGIVPATVFIAEIGREIG